LGSGGFGYPYSLGVGQAFFALPSATVKDAFEHTIKRLELDPTRLRQAEQHFGTIKSLIEEALPGSRVDPIGSFGHGTMIRPANVGKVDADFGDDWEHAYTPIDIDAIVVLGSSIPQAEPGRMVTVDDLLSDVRKALVSDLTYKQMQPRRDRPAITLTFSDEFSVELVPALIDMTNMQVAQRAHPVYLVASEEGGWKWADYDHDSAYLLTLNRSVGGWLLPAIRLCKGFVRSRGLPFSSFHVTLICATFLPGFVQDCTVSGIALDYRHLLWSFLKTLPTILRSPLLLPGSLTPSYRMAEEDAKKAQQPCTLYANAVDSLLSAPDSDSGIKLWRQFYGHPFPSPQAIK